MPGGEGGWDQEVWGKYRRPLGSLIFKAGREVDQDKIALRQSDTHAQCHRPWTSED